MLELGVKVALGKRLHGGLIGQAHATLPFGVKISAESGHFADERALHTSAGGLTALTTGYAHTALGILNLIRGELTLTEAIEFLAHLFHDLLG